MTNINIYSKEQVDALISGGGGGFTPSGYDILSAILGGINGPSEAAKSAITECNLLSGNTTLCAINNTANTVSATILGQSVSITTTASSVDDAVVSGTTHKATVKITVSVSYGGNTYSNSTTPCYKTVVWKILD